MTEKPLTVVHVSYHFHPEMGYDINYLARYVYPGTRMIILSSDKLDLWKTNAAEMKQRDEDFCQRHGVELIRLPSFKTGKKKAGVFIKGLNKAIEKINPDIIFYHGLESISYGWSLWRQTGRRYITGDTHTLFSQFEHMTLPGKLYMYGFFRPLIVRRMAKRGVPVFYTARENKKVLEWFGFAPEHIYSNEICTDTEVFHRVDADAAQLVPDLQPGGKTIIYTGKSDHFKQPHLIADAVRLIQDRIDFPLNLLFVGPDNAEYRKKHYSEPFRNPLIRMVHCSAVPNAELKNYYSIARLAVYPRQNSLSSLDVQACKLPVIMEDDETNRQRLEKGGLIYRPGDLHDLAEKILSVLTDDALHSRLAEEGYQHVIEHFNYRSNLLKMQELFIEDYKKSKK